MALITLSGTESSKWFLVSMAGAHVGVHGTFSGGSVFVEQQINGNTYPIMSEEVAIELTAADDFGLLADEGDIIRLRADGVGVLDCVLSGVNDISGQ